MSAVDKLAPIVAAAMESFTYNGDRVCWCALCGMNGDVLVPALAAHVAAVIASSDDLAVVDLSGAKYDYAPGYRNPSGFILRPIGQPSTEGVARKKLASLANHGTYGSNGERPALLIRRKRWRWEEVSRDGE